MSVRTGVKDSTVVLIKLASERFYSNLQMQYKYGWWWSFTINRKKYDLWHIFSFHYIFTKCDVCKLSSYFKLI